MYKYIYIFFKVKDEKDIPRQKKKKIKRNLVCLYYYQIDFRAKRIPTYRKRPHKMIKRSIYQEDTVILTVHQTAEMYST